MQNVISLIIGVVVSKGTIHTTTDWKTDGKYGLYRRTAANDKGEGAGFEVLLEADEKKEIEEE